MSYICVVGGANIDISSTAYQNIILRDSNPSKITLSLGGVGRNICENLARLGVKTEFVTALANDAYADKIKASCAELGIGVSNCLNFDGNTSTYLCVNDSNGDMFVGASDMTVLDSLNGDFLKGKLSLLNNARAVVIDTNLTRETLQYLLQNVTAPIFVETVSANKTRKLIGLSGWQVIKPNIIEAEMLTGIKIVDDKTLRQAAEILTQKGGWTIITLGEKGAYYFDGMRDGVIQNRVDNIVNTTGAGDSFFAAMIWAYFNGKSIEYATRAGNAAAGVTLQSPFTVSPLLNENILLSKIEE